MAHVFVCYDREDRDFAEVVQAKLERAGHKTAMDLDILSAGDAWQATLDLAIRSSDAIVVIMAPEARASDYVAYEWAFALGAGVKVIPLELRTTLFPPRLDGLHRLDFTGKSRPWDTLLAEVARAEASRPASSIAIDPGTPAAVTQAVRAIDSLVPEERLAAVNTLAQTDHPTALDALTRALEHPVKDVRVAAASVFPDRTNPKIVPGLIDAHRDEWETWFKRGMFGNPPNRLYEGVTRLGASAVPGLLDALKRLGVEPGTHYQLRPTLLQALGKTRSAAALPSLQEALQDEDADIRWAAAGALGELGEPAGAPALRLALADPHGGVRGEAAESLGLLKDAAAVSDLIEFLQNDTPSVRATAAAALGKIGDPSSVPGLIVALGDEDYRVQKAAVEALGRLGDAAAISHLRPLLNQHDTDNVTEMDMEVMTALVRLHDTESLTAIGDRLISFREGTYGGDVYEELVRYGDEGVQVLLRILSSAGNTLSNAIESEAAKALASIRTPEVVSAVKVWRRKHG